MTNLNKRPLLGKYYKLNDERPYKEEKAVKLSKRMADCTWEYELDTTMYFYYTKDYWLSPFKPTSDT